MKAKKKVKKKEANPDHGYYVRITEATHGRLLTFCRAKGLKIGGFADCAIQEALKKNGGGRFNL